MKDHSSIIRNHATSTPLHTELSLDKDTIMKIIVREPAIGLIKWLRPKGLKVCSYVEKCAEFKN